MSSSVREEMIEIDYSRARSKTIFLRHFWKPIAYMAVGGAAVAIWFEEFLDVSSNLLGLLLLPFLTAFLYIFNHFLFKTYKN